MSLAGLSRARSQALPAAGNRAPNSGATSATSDRFRRVPQITHTPRPSSRAASGAPRPPSHRTTSGTGRRREGQLPDLEHGRFPRCGPGEERIDHSAGWPRDDRHLRCDGPPSDRGALDDGALTSQVLDVAREVEPRATGRETPRASWPAAAAAIAHVTSGALAPSPRSRLLQRALARPRRRGAFRLGPAGANAGILEPDAQPGGNVVGASAPGEHLAAGAPSRGRGVRAAGTGRVGVATGVGSCRHISPMIAGQASPRRIRFARFGRDLRHVSAPERPTFPGRIWCRDSSARVEAAASAGLSTPSDRSSKRPTAGIPVR